ncbi:thioredoxin TrxC [candidate division KSB3 bacterium]|uniref:Thioredoxin n=1 Tax=candidate division KSB3 bacterium TaxID=2044937 RepID=A0A9D5Q7D9_9BACT|nr:thioredoxin TrxC [candidate division KSB3 bacterium]MBD3325786.1 thioredoxin TrxC [candidate division KSB3 bacterium]
MDNLVICPCPQCHTRNRVPRERLGQQAKCGKCGANFLATEPSASAPIPVTDATFPQEVLQSPMPVVVDFWAPWCGPCRMIAPVLEDLARDYAGRIKIAKVNTDENQQTAAQYRIQGIPTLLFVKQGQVVDQVVGAVQKPVLTSKIQQML